MCSSTVCSTHYVNVQEIRSQKVAQNSFWHLYTHLYNRLLAWLPNRRVTPNLFSPSYNKNSRILINGVFHTDSAATWLFFPLLHNISAPDSRRSPEFNPSRRTRACPNSLKRCSQKALVINYLWNATFGSEDIIHGGTRQLK